MTTESITLNKSSWFTFENAHHCACLPPLYLKKFPEAELLKPHIYSTAVYCCFFKTLCQVCHPFVTKESLWSEPANSLRIHLWNHSSWGRWFSITLTLFYDDVLQFQSEKVRAGTKKNSDLLFRGRLHCNP